LPLRRTRILGKDNVWLSVGRSRFAGESLEWRDQPLPRVNQACGAGPTDDRGPRHCTISRPRGQLLARHGRTWPVPVSKAGNRDPVGCAGTGGPQCLSALPEYRRRRLDRFLARRTLPLQRRQSHHLHRRERLESEGVSAIADDRKGGLWVAAGRRVHRMEKGRFETLDFPGPPSRRVKAIYQDLQGNMWFGSCDGLLRLSPGAVRDAPASEGRWTTFTTEDGLATDYVQVIIAARDGGLWVGGIGGLSHIRNGQIRAWKEEDGLPSNHVRALYEDAEGVLLDRNLRRRHEVHGSQRPVRQGSISNSRRRTG